MLKTTLTLGSVLAALLSSVNAAAVRGKPEGFGSKATGGAAGPQVTPNTNAELTKYLSQSGPLTIIISKTFDFRGTEGTATETGCAPWGTASACQLAINQDDWCANYEPDAPSVSVTYDVAGVLGILVGSNKSLVGSGTSGVIKVFSFRLLHK